MVDFSGLNRSCLATFGEQVTYYPQDGDPVIAIGVISKSTRPEDAVPGNVTRLFVLLADLPGVPARAEKFTVRGDDYVVTDTPRGDDGGGLELLLRKT